MLLEALKSILKRNRGIQINRWSTNILMELSEMTKKLTEEEKRYRDSTKRQQGRFLHQYLTELENLKKLNHYPIS